MIIRYSMHVDADDSMRPQFDPLVNGGIDLYALTDCVFRSEGQMWIAHVPTAFQLELPPGVHGLVVGRSGNAFRKHITVFNGLIDSSYRGIPMVMLMTPSDHHDSIPRGTAIAQLLLIPHNGQDLTSAKLEAVNTVGESSRGEKGFGSSGRSI